MKNKSRSYSITLVLLLFAAISCDDSDPIRPNSNKELKSDAVVLANDVVNSSLIKLEEGKMTFTSSSEVNKIKVGSVLVGDVTTAAPNGFLRRVVSISTSGNQKVFVTEQASLTDAIQQATVKYSKQITDADIIGVDTSGVDISGGRTGAAPSLDFPFKVVMYDGDRNKQTLGDQIVLEGSMNCQPTFDFELIINEGRVEKFLTQITLKNTSTIKANSYLANVSIEEEVVLKTFKLLPFKIQVGPIPVPVADQYIAIVVGIDGNLFARISTGAENVSTSTAGLLYQGGAWSGISDQQNSFKVLPVSFEGEANITPWVQARYHISPYAVPKSQIYLGLKAFVDGSATASEAGLHTEINWGVQFAGKAEMKLFDRVILDYEKVFFEKQFPVSEKNVFAFPKVSTADVRQITRTSAQVGGNVTSTGGDASTQRGVCWSTTQNPTIDSQKSTDGTGTGNFTANLSGLTANTKYYARAYAKNAAGTSYGDIVSFTTIANTNPEVSTATPVEITSSAARLGGIVTADGGTPVSERGIYWGLTSAPEITGTKVSTGTGTGSFASNVSGLNGNTTYFVRAFAKNAQGTTLGTVVSFTTLMNANTSDITFNPNLAYGTVNDIEGNSYKTIKIGTQIWMAENLRTTKYNDGGTIPAGSNWTALTTPAYTWFDNNPIAYKNTYGALYNWYAASNTKLCPTGWHVPNEAEWTTMTDYLGGLSVAGGKIKETGTTHWTTPNSSANNSSGFTALPGGNRGSNGNYHDFLTTGQWWTSTSADASNGIDRRAFNSNSTMDGRATDKRGGFSIRCMKDTYVPLSGLLGYYPFTGNANDNSGNGNDGVVTGATLTTDRHGNANSAYYFDSNTDIIRVTNNAMLNPDYVSISAWVYYEGASYNAHVVNKNTQVDLFIATSVGSPLGTHINNNVFDAGAIIPKNTWTFLTMIKDHSTISFYVNGAFVKSFPSTGVITPTSADWTFGSRGAETNTSFRGKLDEVRIYNYALNLNEITLLYNCHF